MSDEIPPPGGPGARPPPWPVQLRAFEDQLEEMQRRTEDALGLPPGYFRDGLVAAPPDVALREALRAAPPRIRATYLAGGPGLTLILGPGLSVDLRRGRFGLEVILRPAAALERAVRAEIPWLLAALRRGGVPLTRLLVVPRPAPNPRRAR